MNRQIPFYSNTLDNTHCYQAALKIILKHFQPEKDYTFEELDKLTDKVDGLWTWPQAGILSLRKMGFDVVILDSFDYHTFAEQGINYIRSKYGDQVADAQETHSDIPQAIEYTKLLLRENIKLINNPTLNNIKNLIDEGHLVICNVNQDILNDKTDYTGHFVVVYKLDDNNVEFHDPGLPAFEARKETIDKFLKAWEVSKDAYAFKL